MNLKLDVKHGVNTVYNPTGFEIKGMCEGVEYIIAPFSTEVKTNGQKSDGIYNIYHVSHLIKTCQELGLVSLEYGPKARDKFESFEAYRTHQEIAGLKERLKYQRFLVKMQDAAIKQMKDSGAIIDASYSNLLSKLKKRVEAVELWLKDAGLKVEEIDDEEDFLKRPEWREKSTQEEEVEILKTESGVEYKYMKNGRPMVKEDGKFTMVSNDRLKELGIDIRTV
jgi:hypothetical protein